MSRFIAIPVSQGDAFYLEIPQGSVLVDGGRSIWGFHQLFSLHTGEKGVDILVATHNDADHANGVLGFLKAGLDARGLWLPGRWAQVLPYALRPWEAVVILLLKGTRSVSDQISGAEGEGTALEQYGNTVRDVRWEEAGIWVCDESGWPIEAIALLEHAAEDETDEETFWLDLQNVVLYWRGWFPLYVGGPIENRLLREALVAAARIRMIALEAFRQGIRVRWFEYSGQPSGGNGWLRPLNAKEVASIRILRWRSDAETFVMHLALTPVNKESLVLWASTDECPGVLLTADSDLRGIHLPSANGPIITAPHHGSEANKWAYQAIAQSGICEPIWVRSDGRSKRRPCAEYLKAPGSKMCTVCRNSERPKQAVLLHEMGGKWIRSRYTRPCSCR